MGINSGVKKLMLLLIYITLRAALVHGCYSRRGLPSRAHGMMLETRCHRYASFKKICVLHPYSR